MITANTVRQSTEGGWWDPPLFLPTYRNYREFLKPQRESCRAGGFVGSYRAVRSVIGCKARNRTFEKYGVAIARCWRLSDVTKKVSLVVFVMYLVLKLRVI
jgi:hypothetical protein